MNSPSERPIRLGGSPAATEPPESTSARIVDQPPPLPSTAPLVKDAVIADIEALCTRRHAKYGTHLRPHNGRDALLDLYEELIDGALYLRQAMAERDAPIPAQQLHAYRAEAERQTDLAKELRRQLDARDRQVARLRWVARYLPAPLRHLVMADPPTPGARWTGERPDVGFTDRADHAAAAAGLTPYPQEAS